jgi:hypothetical protein
VGKSTSTAKIAKKVYVPAFASRLRQIVEALLRMVAA